MNVTPQSSRQRANSDVELAKCSTTAVNASTPSVVTETQARRLPRGLQFAVFNAALQLRCEQWLHSHGMVVDALSAIERLPIGGKTGTLSDAVAAAATLKSIGLARGYRCVALADLPRLLESGLAKEEGHAFALTHSRLLTPSFVVAQKEKLLATGECDLPVSLGGWLRQGAPEDGSTRFKYFEHEAADPATTSIVFLSMEAAYEAFQSSTPIAAETRGAEEGVSGVVVVFDVVSAMAVQHTTASGGSSPAQPAAALATPIRNRFASVLGAGGSIGKGLHASARGSLVHRQLGDFALAAEAEILTPARSSTTAEWSCATVVEGADAYISSNGQICAVVDPRQLVPRYIIRV